MYRRRFIVLVVLAFALVAAACSSSDGGAEAAEEPMTDESSQPTDESVEAEPSAAPTDEGFIAQDGDLVEVHYVGTLDDGSEFDASRPRGAPLSFTVGSGQVSPGVDEAVRGRRVGDVHTVRIEAADAYGERSDDNIVQVPFNPDQGDIEVGDQVFLNNGLQATILEITDEYVLLDANHPLAGEALTFEIEVVSITRG